MSEPKSELLPLELDEGVRLPLVGAGRRRTGERVDPALVERIIEMRAQGETVAAIRRETACDPRTILTIIRRAQETGMLAQTKDQLVAIIEDVARLAGDEMLRRLAEQPERVPANVLPVMFGVAMDKRALLLGEAETGGATVTADPMERLRDAYASLQADVSAASSPTPAESDDQGA